MPPKHHKELASFLRDNFSGDCSVVAYRDNNGNRPIPIGKFGEDFYSSIGAFDMGLCLPAGNYEFATCGRNKWLPNSLASSIYWLSERNCNGWPLVCEEVVRDNARSAYRHMAYVPSPFGLTLSTGQIVKWLMGIPVTDIDINISEHAALERAKKLYPEWLFCEIA